MTGVRVLTRVAAMCRVRLGALVGVLFSTGLLRDDALDPERPLQSVQRLAPDSPIAAFPSV
jgi:hypothetical protein